MGFTLEIVNDAYMMQCYVSMPMDSMIALCSIFSEKYKWVPAESNAVGLGVYKNWGSSQGVNIVQ